jgi:hypothetical protein
MAANEVIEWRRRKFITPLGGTMAWPLAGIAETDPII